MKRAVKAMYALSAIDATRETMLLLDVMKTDIDTPE